MTQFDPPFDAPRLGVFASKAPTRPNPIAISTVRITRIDHERGLIETPRIDALDGTPILDIKPYLPFYDRVASPGVPGWASRWPQWMPEEGVELDQIPE